MVYKHQCSTYLKSRHEYLLQTHISYEYERNKDNMKSHEFEIQHEIYLIYMEIIPMPDSSQLLL